MDTPVGDIAFINGKVITGGFEPSTATGVAIRLGRIAAVGSDSEVRAAIGPHTEVIDLKGRTIAPGLNDAHCHPMWVGLGMTTVNCASPPNATVADIVQRIAERVRATPTGGWVMGRGYDQARLDDQRHPTRYDLDPVSPNNPVIVVRACGHIAAVNSRALELAGIDRNTPDPEGGTIDRDAHGEPTGVVREAAQTLVRSVMPEPTKEQLQAALIAAGNDFLSKGVTSVAEAGIYNPTQMRAYVDLRNEGRLPVRTYLMMMIDEMLDHMIALGIRTGFGDEWLRIGPAKFFLDGSIGGRTARMSRPYEGEESNVGLWMDDPEAMKARFVRAHKAGFQCCAHAIGDAAITLLLDAYEQALAEDPRPDHRHRIEHCSIVDLEMVRRIKRVGAVPIPGTSFLYAFQNAYIQNLGMERIRYAYGMNTYYEHGIVAAASTDAPVVSTSATIGLQTMLTRRSEEGQVLWEEEAVSLEEAVRAYSYNGAYASFEERIKGTLEVGKLGDAVVFETDISAVPAHQVGAVQVDLTIADGRIVYDREAAGRATAQ
ncbi:MAG: amidohydrolase [Chloroflexi bacterium]|nr:MAG: amidohydrolase [Chloroflexota bacterium]